MQVDGLALLVVDPQRDFCSPEGVYTRHGVAIEPICRILAPLAELMVHCRQCGVPTIATQFTIVTDRHGRALLGRSLLAARPFLAEEGFRAGTPGHGIADELPVPDYLVEKPTFSAFYATRLDYLLAMLNVRRLGICGVGTNGAVESTVRDAQVRNLEVTLVTDCTAGFSAELHEASVRSMATLARLATSRELVESLKTA